MGHGPTSVPVLADPCNAVPPASIDALPSFAAPIPSQIDEFGT
jgi:hypothetical protein